MLVGSPAPGVAADWHRSLNVAAAKLAIAAGVTPAEVRRASGLRRIEIKRARGPIHRQVTALAHAAVLTAQEIPDELISGAETTARILEGVGIDELGPRYLAICEKARHNERLHIYRDHTEAFTRELTAIVDEFARCKKKVKDLDEEYELIGEHLAALAKGITASTPWPARRVSVQKIEELVRKRDSLRALFATTLKQTGAVMDRYRRHQAKRVYYHSRHVPQYRSEAMVFIPSSTLRRMLVCPFEEVSAGPAFREKALRLMKEWNTTCEQFAIERRRLHEEHKTDEIRDHTLRAAIANHPSR
ncbi:hypothetical protein [Mycolicibacterium gadium]|uniref:Uncharacterized protein n=1 Tax=Mycolicibacterium gadium TaxID=1794 RepID=A0A7I7WMW8_MYCGU|nr:hypothetical protein [Mycolicibacterium gadium]BBZ19019.1 hypothetical protein MGAD_33540 [Mycolicibacterium gadium]